MVFAMRSHFSATEERTTTTLGQGNVRDEHNHLTFSLGKDGSAGLLHSTKSCEISVPWLSDPFLIFKEDCISASHILQKFFATWYITEWGRGYLKCHLKIYFLWINLVRCNILVKSWVLSFVFFFFFLNNSLRILHNLYLKTKLSYRSVWYNMWRFWTCIYIWLNMFINRQLELNYRSKRQDSILWEGHLICSLYCCKSSSDFIYLLSNLDPQH